MDTVLNYIDKVPWLFVLIACATLGLAPFNPPHIVEKLRMLAQGDLRKLIDWFDLFYHSLPWIILILKSIVAFKK